jgi:hypothetical protein
MKKIMALICISVILAMTGGCSVTANKYTVAPENVQKLRASGNSKVSVGKFSAAEGKEAEVNGLTMRGGNFASPYNNSYPAYLQKALTSELSFAGRLGNDGKILVSGVMLSNKFDGSGINEGNASVSARIKVVRGGVEKYNKVVATDFKWESYFAAFNATPAAQIAYVHMIQKFLSKLYSDTEFVNAIK